MNAGFHEEMMTQLYCTRLRAWSAGIVPILQEALSIGSPTSPRILALDGVSVTERLQLYIR